MSKIKVLLAGESWISTTTHVKGFDDLSNSEYLIGIDGLIGALKGSDIELVHLPGHQVPTKFPKDLNAFNEFDVVVLSDIGSNSIVLHPDTFVRGQRTPNRLKVLKEWVSEGGGFMMVGGYYSFQGLNAGARYHRTAVEEILPVSMQPYDDRTEMPEGYHPVVSKSHPVIEGISGPWPYLLGYNQVEAKDGADVVMMAGDSGDPLLVAGQHGRGRTMAWTSDIGPHWLPTEFIDWDGYAKLWVQAFHWLAGR